jgi:hypothetical protein
MGRCFVVLNSDGSIYTVSGKADTVLSRGQSVVSMNMSMGDFCASLPAAPHLCKRVNGLFVQFKEEEAVLIYNPDALISLAMQNVISSIPATTDGQKADRALAITAFIDFANKATESSKENFLLIASMLGMTEVAMGIIAEAKNMGAEIS